VTFEARTQASAKTEPDIAGNPVVVLAEVQGSDSSFTLASAYQSIAVVNACIAAYQQNTSLTLVDETGGTLTVKIKEYPMLVRNKQLGSVVYTITLTLQAESTTPSIPTLSTTGPRLFK
jgi:hypothetical protein